ncbi:MAG: TAXI family TRAP transporter solute-binding subunit [Beijerinckiaceae bacterium]|nr:TAXI family TRAP transporter solute-binding subunit [Beijerinckiaceae bacterium]
MFKALAIAAGLAVLTSAASAQPIGIGTSPQGTLTYTLAATYAKVAQQSLGLQVRVQPSSGTGVMVPLVDSGELDVGFVNTLELSASYSGTGDFINKAQKNLRAVAVLFPIQSGFFVRKDSPIKTMADIKGKRLPYGYTSQQVIRTVTDGVLANAGLTADDMKLVLVPNLIRGTDEFIAGNTDIGYFAAGQAKVAEADAAVGGLRYIPLSDAPEAVERMRKVLPTSYIATLDPAPNRAGIAEPTKLLYYDYVMFVNEKVSKDVVYKLTQVLYEKQKELIEGMPLFRQTDVKRLYRESTVPYHPGAIAFYKDKGVELTK